MGMSTHVVGFRQADEKWKSMKTIWDACVAANVPIPKPVEDFFDGEAPGDKPGMEVSIDAAVMECNDDYRAGYEVNVAKLPQGVTTLRFYNSW